MENDNARYLLQNITEDYTVGFGGDLNELRIYIRHVHEFTNDEYKIIDTLTDKEVYQYPIGGVHSNAK